MNFGAHIKKTRLDMGLSLRAFCLEHGEDPSNWSRLERGMMRPPESLERIAQIGHYLAYEDDSPEMQGFFDLADTDRGTIPADIMSNEDLIEKLPLVFRTLRGAPTKEELMTFCEANLARFKLPRVLKVVDDLPKTAIGKIQKNVLRDMYA